MERLEEVLPGIEEFLTSTLLCEQLSKSAEKKRRELVEKIEILKLPPSVPLRGQKNDESLLVVPSSPRKIVTEEVDAEQENDFAAYQRALSRQLVKDSDSSFLLEPNIEEIEDDDETEKVKVYDDIDIGIDIESENTEEKRHRRKSDGSVDTNFYEIPVLSKSLTQDDKKNTDYESADSLVSNKSQNISHGNSKEDAHHKEEGESIDENDGTDDTPPLPESKPPPLPPRKERAFSDPGCHEFIIVNKEEKPPDLPARPVLPSKLEIYNLVETKSKNSPKKPDTNDGDSEDGTSYESCDEPEDKEIMNKLNIKLPRISKKQKGHHKSNSKSRSSKEWDVVVPFSALEEVTLTGELQYKGKLSWTKKLIALTEGKMVCYKPDKREAKPSLVINIMGYESSVVENVNKRGFDIRLVHPALETHIFLTDFRDWAQMWSEYINAMALGKPPPGQYHHLARGSTFGILSSGQVYNSKTNISKSSSNISTCSSDNAEYDSNSLKKRKKHSRKVHRMGSIALRATQFFESIGKNKPVTVRRSDIPTSTSLGDLKESQGPPSLATTPVTPCSLPENSMFHEERSAECSPNGLENIRHQGHLHIYSSYNRRRWGKRWCVVRNGNFECYRNKSSKVCELEIWLRNCFLYRAVDETKSDLGLMLKEKDVEKITIEPLNAKDMAVWLHVLMDETLTQDVPEGLEEFLVIDESFYHDINNDDLQSPNSDVFRYSSLSENASEHEKGLDAGSPGTEQNRTLRPKSTEDIDDFGNTRISGDLTGDLYTQVRKGPTGTMSPASRNSFEGLETQEQPLKSNHVVLNDNSYLESQSDFVDDHEGSGGSMFADIITRFDRHLSQENDIDVAYDHNDQGQHWEKNSDTAYNSKSGSENNSLERKSRIYSEDIAETPSESATDFLISPIEENQTFPDQSISMHLSSEEDHTCAGENAKNLNNTGEFLDVKKSNKNSRDQCDSAIYEPDSFTENGDELEQEAKGRLEQMRKNLAQLKEKRISIRDQKNAANSSEVKEKLAREYERLDEECKSVTNQISELEIECGQHIMSF